MRLWVIKMVRQTRRSWAGGSSQVEFRTLIGRHETSFSEARNYAVYQNWLGSEWITWSADELPFFPAVVGS